MSAHNGSGSEIGGQIAAVSAWGPIGGVIQAAHSIEYVRSGDAVTATLTAPSTATRVEFSESVFDEHPLPELPERITEQVLAEGAQAYAQVLAQRDEVAAEIAAILAEFAKTKAAEARDREAAALEEDSMGPASPASSPAVMMLMPRTVSNRRYGVSTRKPAISCSI